MVWRFVTIFLVKVEFNDLCGLIFCLYVLGLLLSSVILGYTGKSTGPKYRNGQAVTMKKKTCLLNVTIDNKAVAVAMKCRQKRNLGLSKRGENERVGPCRLQANSVTSDFYPSIMRVRSKYHGCGWAGLRRNDFAFVLIEYSYFGNRKLRWTPGRISITNSDWLTVTLMND